MPSLLNNLKNKTMKRNVIIQTEEETTLIYDVSTRVSNDNLKNFFEIVLGEYVSDIYEVTQDEIQYFMIDSRFYFDENKESILLKN